MVEIKTLEVSGFVSSLQALRLPFNKECRSMTSSFINSVEAQNHLITTTDVIIDERDLQLMRTLIARGAEHAKVMRGIIVYAEINAPIYWWCELECYRAGHERLCSESTMHTDCRGLSGDALVEVKASIPMGRCLKKVDYFSYQCLRNIVKQRSEHRLPEWHEFIDWVRTLPFATELIYG